MSKKQPKIQQLPPVQEVLYVDANRQHSIKNNTETNNEWTYKLNENLYLPKGSTIELEHSFLNLKGITGQSIEIEEDIIEEITFGFYVNELPHNVMLNEYKDQGINTCWFRPTLCCPHRLWRNHINRNTDRVNDVSEKEGYCLHIGYEELNYSEFTVANAAAQANGTFTTVTADTYNSKYFMPNFTAFGGTGIPLMMCDPIKQDTNDPNGSPNIYLQPRVKTLRIKVPKGIYGVGQLATFVEDYFTGQKFLDDDGNIQDKTDYRRRAEEDLPLGKIAQSDIDDLADGNIYNSPFITPATYAPRRMYNLIRNDPVITDLPPVSCFVDMDTFNYQMDALTTFTNTGTQGTMLLNEDVFSLYNLTGKPKMSPNPTIVGATNTDVWGDKLESYADGDNARPVYYFVPAIKDTGKYENEAPSTTRSTMATIKIDGDDTFFGYNPYTSSSMDFNLVTSTIGSLVRQRMVGTSNFGFAYNSDNNGYDISGLHNQTVGMSHDRYGAKLDTAGKKVVRTKKVRNDFFGDRVFKGINSNVNGATQGNTTERIYNGKRMSLLRAYNTPETRDSGVMIFNWARVTAQETGNRFQTVNGINPLRSVNQYTRFKDYYQSETDAKLAWNKTLWARLGFTYDQLANPDKYEINTIFDKRHTDTVSTPTGAETGTRRSRNYGFTTNTTLDNSIWTTVSSLNNALSGEKGGSSKNLFSGLQIPSMGTMTASAPFGNAHKECSFTNSPYTETMTYDIEVDDVGGTTAKNLPTLSKQSYFIITSDILDNYKDNVKKGDPIPLLGVVPKSNLSNQDFIEAQNQIQQQTLQDKIVNKIKITVLNPDLSAPQLDEFSSVVLKITRPNIIPPSIDTAPEITDPNSGEATTDLTNI